MITNSRPVIVKKSAQLYRKVEEVHHYRPTPEEIYYYYSGTHAGLNPDNPYAPRHRYSTKIYFEPVKEKK